ncbi:uncharacterized protein [Nicotiana tomentosiformis]|uniref:uncharacterized protein n=1 Tax=Nicotiana tomentosiformis TaxID=4098 RepID=UPI00388C3433
MLEDILRACVLDFKGSLDDHSPLIEFFYSNSYHASIQMEPFEALYGRRYRSPIVSFEIGEAELIGPDLVHQAMEKVSPMKGIMRFGKKGKLSTGYVGSYRIIQRIGQVAYKLELPLEVSLAHRVYHVSMLKKASLKAEKQRDCLRKSVMAKLTGQRVHLEAEEEMWISPITRETLAKVSKIKGVSQNLDLLVYEVTVGSQWMLMADHDPRSRMNDPKRRRM